MHKICSLFTFYAYLFILCRIFCIPYAYLYSQNRLFIGRKKFLVGAAMCDTPPHPFHTTAGGTGGDIDLSSRNKTACVKVPTCISFFFYCLLNLAGVYNVHRLYTLQSLGSSYSAASSTIPIMSIKGIVLNNMQSCVCLCIVLGLYTFTILYTISP